MNKPLEPPLGRRLYLAQRAQHDRIDARMAEHGASLWNWVLLRSAGEKDGQSQRELAGRMYVEPPTLVRHLDRLAQEGLLERRRDAHDRRVMRISLTAAGRRRLAELHAVVMEVDAELRALLTPREADVLARALQKIYEQFSGSERQKGTRGGDA